MITKDELLRRKELYEKGELSRKEIKPVVEESQGEKKTHFKRDTPEYHERLSAAIKKARREHPERWANTGGALYAEKRRLAGRTVWNRKKVRCVETGEVFTSISKANDFCRENGASNKALKRALSDKEKTAAGYHWELVKKG